MKKIMALALLGLSGSAAANAATLLQERFNDARIASRGWYDNTSVTISAAEHAPKSTSSAAFAFQAGATTPTNGGSMRRQFRPSPTIYISYWVKYDSNWQDQTGGAGHHEIYLLTNRAPQYTNLAFTNLTAYLESWGTAGQAVAAAPHLSFQDGANIDQSNINVDLTEVTEFRSVTGCNGVLDPQYVATCYKSGNGAYWNGKHIPGPSGTISLGTWHHVEAYYKLNSIVNGKGVADGVTKYWLDGKLLMDHRDVMMRTAQFPDMAFNQLVIGPYMCNGSPVTQTMYLDDILITDTLPGGTRSTTLAAPGNLVAR